jgi:hypothetical protein
MQSRCRVCHALAVKSSRAKNPEKQKQKRHENYLKNKEKVAKQVKEWRLENAERYKQKALEYRLKNPSIYIEGRKKYLENNAERHKENVKRWSLENKEQRLQIGRNWSAKNPSKIREKAARRRSCKLNATPSWLSRIHVSKISEFYELASSLTASTGEEWHVDHIVPLRGANVCGLHVPWNLQVITKHDNLRKSNTLAAALSA